MARPPATAFHYSLRASSERLDATLGPDGSLTKAVDGLGGSDAKIEALDHRVGHLEALVGILSKNQHRIIHHLMLYGVQHGDGGFVPNTPLAVLLIAAGYKSVRDVARATAPRGRKPWQRIHDDLTKIYQSDTAKYAPPPEPAEVEALYDICVANS